MRVKLLTLAFVASSLALESCTPKCCLTQEEGSLLALSYENTWTGKYTDLNYIMMDNFQAYENYGQPDGDTVPWANTTKAFKEAISTARDPKQSDYILDHTEILNQWIVCDTIVVSWKSYANTTGLSTNSTGVGKGQMIAYKGIDILTVDLKQRKLSKVLTSEDGINRQMLVGYTLRGNKQKCS